MAELLRATIDEIDEVAGLYDDLIDYLTEHRNYPGWMKGVYPNRDTAEAGIQAGTLYILRQEGRIAGTIILSHEPEEGYKQVNWKHNLDDKDIFVIHTFAVHPMFLKQGMGMEVMKWAMNYCREAGAKAIRLDTYKNNLPAIHLYQKCGFEYMDTVDLGYGEYGLDYFELYQMIL